MNLNQLLSAAQLSALTILTPAEPDPAWDAIEITGIQTDSRPSQPGALFIGMPGSKVDGGQFWEQAAQQGAVAALVSDPCRPATPGRIPILTVPADDMAMVCGEVAGAFYGFPGRSLSLVGVTGTNGKTTTTHLIEYLLQAAGQDPLLLGTLYTRWPGSVLPALHTTPFAPELHSVLAQARDAGCRLAVMEVSSHSLAQQRVWGCEFDVAVWTNLTQDHLDFHATMDNYWQAKATLFGRDYLKGRAVINADDAGGRQLLQHLQTVHDSDPLQPGLDPWVYSLHPPRQLTGVSPQSWIWPEEVEWDSSRIRATVHTPLGSSRLEVPLAGSYNLANLLAALGAVLHLGVSLETIQAALPQFTGVPGRMETVRLPETPPDLTVIVDYAHTPDGLENVLRAVRPLVGSGKLICVFGCGGDRDRSKRPQMGAIAAAIADQVVVTSDNPRTEDPERILADIVAGLATTATPYQVQADRKAAIVQAILAAQPGDTVVIAGKGHEDYQILGTTKIHFDDREVAREALITRGSNRPNR